MKEGKLFSETYSEFKEENKKAVAAFAGKRQLSLDEKRFFVFPFIEDLGFDTWDKINSEITEIYHKKSTLSKAVRDSLITIYNNVTKSTIEFNKP